MLSENSVKMLKRENVEKPVQSMRNIFVLGIWEDKEKQQWTNKVWLVDLYKGVFRANKKIIIIIIIFFNKLHANIK